VIFVVEVDAAAAGHLAAALARYFTWARDNGLRPPTEFVGFADRCLAEAKRLRLGQDGAHVDVLAGLMESAAMPEPLLVDQKEVARLLNTSISTVKRMVAAGQLPGVKLGRATRVRRADVDAYVEGLAPGPFRRRIATKSRASS
jgi:excisionase family DNA binding protein